MNNTKIVFSKQRKKSIILTLLCLMPIIGMAVDLIAPSLPAIAKGLNVSHVVVKDIITLYLIGYAFGNFFTGFLTDALGRKKLIRIGLLGFVLASLLPILIPHMWMLLISRLLQGLTIGAAAVVIRAIVSDILTPDELIKIGVLLGSMFGLGPVIGPLIGGYLQFYLGWKACFAFFAIIALVAFMAVIFVIPETHFNRHPLHIKTITNNLTEVVSHKKFMAMVLIMGAVYSLMITFNTVGPFLIQTILHYNPVFFGHIALCMGLFFLLATIVCRYLLNILKVERLLLIFINAAFVVAVLATLASYMDSNNITLITVISACMFFACGFIFPMSMGKGVSLFQHISGTATATMYLINILMTSVVAFILSFINIQTSIPMIWTFLILILICVILYWTVLHESGAKETR